MNVNAHLGTVAILPHRLFRPDLQGTDLLSGIRVLLPAHISCERSPRTCWFNVSAEPYDSYVAFSL
jgi:hypothetical protein